MICPVCQQPQPGPHGAMCRIDARELAHKMTMAELLYESTPWEDAVTMGAMLARLDAFLVRYSDVCESDAMSAALEEDDVKRLLEKAASVRALAKPKIGGMYV